MKQYTAGELAKQLGVSARTVRFYDEKNLLPPCGYTEAGYRLYDENSMERLQKIIMLKFLDFTLDQICEMMKEDKLDIQESLKEQEQMLRSEKEHIERIIEAVRKAREASDEELWDNMRNVIDMTKDREKVIQQYRTDENLNKRISIHDYSTSKEGFYSWLFRKVELKPYMKVLEIGCGNAYFWKTVADRLPEGLEIHLTDYSDGMLESAAKVVAEIQEKYPEKELKFILDKRDATQFSYTTDGFDRIMANHMLYHLTRESRQQLYPKIKELLAADGRFSCTLIGKTHFRELNDFMKEYYSESQRLTANIDFWLEDAPEEINQYFNIVAVEEQKNDLLVPDEELVYEYVTSYSKDVKEFSEHDKRIFLDRVRSKMNADGCMYIHKSAGIVVCEPRL